MFEVKKIIKNIYLVQFDDQYQLCMHFLRFQEYYESPRFAGENFELIDLMEWYSKKYGKGSFTYAVDWGGFNLPGKFILDHVPPDENRYDRLMRSIAEYIRADAGHSDFYVIGVKKSDDKETFKHEIAHGLFSTDPDYCDKMTDLVNGLPDKFVNKFRKTLLDMCYSEAVVVDEMQAYLSTGLITQVAKVGKKYQKPFQKVFNSYYKRIK